MGTEDLTGEGVFPHSGVRRFIQVRQVFLDALTEMLQSYKTQVSLHLDATHPGLKLTVGFRLRSEMLLFEQHPASWCMNNPTLTPQTSSTEGAARRRGLRLSQVDKILLLAYSCALRPVFKPFSPHFGATAPDNSHLEAEAGPMSRLSPYGKQRGDLVFRLSAEPNPEGSPGGWILLIFVSGFD